MKFLSIQNPAISTFSLSKKSTMLTPDDNSIKSRKDDHNQFMIAGGNQAPELEIQHEMNHFPSFPIGSSTPRVPREYSTRRTTSGYNYQRDYSYNT